MRRKVFITFSALFLTTVGAFYYGGAPERTAASDEIIIAQESPQSFKQVEYKNQNVEEDFFNNHEDKIEKTSVNVGTNPSEEKPEEPKEEPKEESGLESNEPQEEIKSEDTIEYGDSTYVSLMNESRFQHWIDIALKYDSKLYAIQNSDVFGFFKDGEIIIGMSTGVKSAHPDYVEMLKEVFSGDGFLYEGVVENIDFVNKTGAKVNVEFEPYVGYVVYKESDGRIVVSW